MHNLLKFYNQNRKKIWVYMLGIFLVILILQTLNAIAKRNNNERINNASNSSSNSNTTTIANKLESYSVVTETKISENKAKENITTIKKFIEYCNNKEIENAYNLLSDECKQLVFPTIENFKTNYYNNRFTQEKTCGIELWITHNEKYTYKVQLLNDILSTGNVDDANSIYDYFTIVKNDKNETKLNICNYVGREYINCKNVSNNIEIEVISKDIYIDYEIYNIKIKNNSDQTILLDSKKNINTIYLIDTNEVKYSSYLYENDIKLLEIGSKQIRSLKIKFNKIYNPNRVIDKMYFTNIILDYDKYIQNENYDEFGKIAIDV